MATRSDGPNRPQHDPNETTTTERATPLAPGEPVAVPPTNGSTFAGRAAARKAVQDGENKAVKAAEKK